MINYFEYAIRIGRTAYAEDSAIPIESIEAGGTGGGDAGKALGSTDGGSYGRGSDSGF